MRGIATSHNPTFHKALMAFLSLLEDEQSYHSAKSEGGEGEDLFPQTTPSAAHLEETGLHPEEKYGEREDSGARNKMHIDPEDPRTDTTSGRYRPRNQRYQQHYRNPRNNGGDSYYQ